MVMIIPCLWKEKIMTYKPDFGLISTGRNQPLAPVKLKELRAFIRAFLPPTLPHPHAKQASLYALFVISNMLFRVISRRPSLSELAYLSGTKKSLIINSLSNAG
jgi:hypothetical protein